MYNLIDTHIQTILNTIPQNHVTEYDWLIQNLDQCGTPEYQARYRKYWRLNTAQLSANYCNDYFQSLQSARLNPPTAGNLAHQLYATPTHKGGRQSLQFSFATKLLHMVNPNTPIYDSMVGAFYFFQAPGPKIALPQRVAALVMFHNYLGQEYQRICANNLLAVSIQAFRQRFNPHHFTEEKVIDSLIWAFVALLRDGGITNGTISYGTSSPSDSSDQVSASHTAPQPYPFVRAKLSM